MSGEEDSATKQVLELIGLAHDEVNTYFKITGRGPVMVGEIALLTNISEDRAAEIANNLFNKGLLKQIPGKMPIYEALPPYAALVGQIHQFKEAIKKFQTIAPQNIQVKFDSLESHSAKLKKLDDYKTYLQIMKTKLPAEIKTQFDRFEKELEQVKRFQDVRRFIFNLKEIVPADITRDFQAMESRLDSVKSEIATRFEKQFRIGALSNMAEKIVSKVISEQFTEITKTFRDKFVQTTQNMLDQVINQLGSITDTAGEISTDLGTVFTDIQNGMVTTLEDLETRVSGVYDDIISGINELKDLFRTEIFESIQDDIINNIINQLESAEMTMTEFWERSKQASLLSFKDVWFVRSLEGIKAQINESLTRVKMRVHIVAPKLEDIDLIALTKLKKHINIRISANFDLTNPEDQMRFKQVENYSNLTIRHYPRENLWSINKDFEEVVVCFVSKTD
ncbi:MAG: helix-turn-helix domain-containing protein, partial [Promethearchaeota archaeon]